MSRALLVLALLASLAGCGMKAGRGPGRPSACAPARATPAHVTPASEPRADDAVDGEREQPSVCREPETRPAELEQRLRSLAVELEAQADCGRACGLAGNICDIAEELCRLAGDNPGDAELQARCDDARGRCARARERVAATCPECQ